jgi:two-component system sensor histidine kinase/response regulator
VRRFLQGRDTDKRQIVRMSKAIHAGEDIHVVLLNYTKSGKPFWNELFCAPLRNAQGQVVHFVGVQSAIAPEHVGALLKAQEEEMAAEDAAHDGSASGAKGAASGKPGAIVGDGRRFAMAAEPPAASRS